MCGETKIHPSEEGRHYVLILKVLMGFQLAIVVLNFVSANLTNQFLIEGLFGLLFIVLLFIAQKTLSYTALTMYIFFSIYFAVNFCVAFLVPVQNGVNFKAISNQKIFSYVVAVLSCAYYIFCCIFLFWPYRSFKSLAFAENPAIAQSYASEDEDNQGRKQNRKNGYENQVTKPTFETFAGVGVRIG